MNKLKLYMLLTLLPLGLKPAAALTPEELAQELAESGLVDRNETIVDLPGRPERSLFESEDAYKKAYTSYRKLLKVVRDALPRAIDQAFLNKQKNTLTNASTVKELTALKTLIEQEKEVYEGVQGALGKLEKQIVKKIASLKKEEEEKALDQGARLRADTIAGAPAFQPNVVRVIFQLLILNHDVQELSNDLFNSEAFCPIHGMCDESKQETHYFRIHDCTKLPDAKKTQDTKRYFQLNKQKTKVTRTQVVSFSPEEIEAKIQTILNLPIVNEVAEYRKTAPETDRPALIEQGVDPEKVTPKSVRKALQNLYKYEWICNIK